MSLLKVQDLHTQFETEDGLVRAADGVSFEVSRGETVGLVGESGSGKSVTARSILRLIEPPGRIASGRVEFDGRDLLALSEAEMQSVRGGEISMIFQDPMSALNPVLTVGEQIARIIERHRADGTPSSLLHRMLGRKARGRGRKAAVELLKRVGIPDPENRVDDYPHQFSGGMQQRVVIAMAISCNPVLLIADEPTTALDVTIEAQIFQLLYDLREDLAMGILLITHDLGVVAQTCDRVLVMYAGRIVESGPVEEIFHQPLHPYTRGLLASIPAGSRGEMRLEQIQGSVPELVDLPAYCRFEPRCPDATPACQTIDPSLQPVESNHYVACIHAPGWNRSSA